MAHCVSQDLHLGKGIARIFKHKFGGISELKKQNLFVGDVGVLLRNGRYIYYLVTKNMYFSKPSYTTLRKALESMRAHIISSAVKFVSVPKISCGLDQLKWVLVKRIIEDVFHTLPLTITVYIK